MERVIANPLPITGTPKQIAWAESIRKKAMSFVSENAQAINEVAKDKGTAKFLLIAMGTTTSAKTWIEKHKQGLKTAEEAVALLFQNGVFHEPLTEAERARLRYEDKICRMEAAIGHK